MKTREHRPLPRLRRRLVLLPGLLFASAVLADDAPVLSAPSDVRDLLRDAQAARIPSPNTVTQDLGSVVVEPAMALSEIIVTASSANRQALGSR